MRIMRAIRDRKKYSIGTKFVNSHQPVRSPLEMCVTIFAQVISTVTVTVTVPSEAVTVWGRCCNLRRRYHHEFHKREVSSPLDAPPPPRALERGSDVRIARPSGRRWKCKRYRGNRVSDRVVAV